jgi:carbonic anhydrase
MYCGRPEGAHSYGGNGGFEQQWWIMDHGDALERLVEGNRRYSEGRFRHPHLSKARRKEIVGGQTPFAAVLGCADSRVPPELIFDQGVGDLFVVRVAGNVVDDIVTASLEYAAQHLGVRLVLVLGHTSCGAITAALRGEAEAGHLASISAALAPAIAEVSPDSADPVAATAVAHARQTAKRLSGCRPVLSRLSETGSVRIVPACYDLATGAVDFLEH